MTDASGAAMFRTTAEAYDRFVGRYGAELIEVSVSAAVVTAGYADFAELWHPMESGVDPAGSYAAALSPERRDALQAELRRRVGVGGAPFALTARVGGHRPRPVPPHHMGGATARRSDEDHGRA